MAVKQFWIDFDTCSEALQLEVILLEVEFGPQAVIYVILDGGIG